MHIDSLHIKKLSPSHNLTRYYLIWIEFIIILHDELNGKLFFVCSIIVCHGTKFYLLLLVNSISPVTKIFRNSFKVFWMFYLENLTVWRLFKCCLIYSFFTKSWPLNSYRLQYTLPKKIVSHKFSLMCTSCFYEKLDKNLSSKAQKAYNNIEWVVLNITKKR